MQIVLKLDFISLEKTGLLLWKCLDPLCIEQFINKKKKRKMVNNSTNINKVNKLPQIIEDKKRSL